MIRTIKPSTHDTVWIKDPNGNNWVIDKTRINTGVWDANGVLIRYYANHDLGISFKKL